MRFTNPHPKICARNEIQFTTSIYNTMQHKVLNFIISSFIFYKNVINFCNIYAPFSTKSCKRERTMRKRNEKMVLKVKMFSTYTYYDSSKKWATALSRTILDKNTLCNNESIKKQDMKLNHCCIVPYALRKGQAYILWLLSNDHTMLHFLTTIIVLKKHWAAVKRFFKKFI